MEKDSTMAINRKKGKFGLNSAARDYLLEFIRQTPVLSQEEEISLIAQAQKGDLKARDKLTEAHLRTIIQVIRPYWTSAAMSKEDLFQEGYFGLARAIEKFNPDKAAGASFSTYACRWIKSAVGNFLNNCNQIIRIPADAQRKCYKIKEIEAELNQELCRHPTWGEIAARGNMSEKKVIDIILKCGRKMSILDESNDKETRNPAPESGAMQHELHEKLMAVLGEMLTPKEKLVLIEHYGLEDGNCRTLEEIGESFCVKRQRIDQLKRKALKKLIESPEFQELKCYLFD